MPPPGNNLFARFVPLLLMLVLTLAALHPLPWRMADEVLQGNRDQKIFLWNLWWVNHAVTTLHRSPFTTDHLFAPEGVSLAYHTLCSASGFLGILLGSNGNLLLASNLLLLLSFVLGGWFAYLLVRELSGSRGGAFFGAILFAFGPAHWYPVYRGQMHIYTTQWMPLFLLAMIRFLRKPGWQNSLLMSFSLAAIFYTSYQQVVFTFILVLLVLPAVLPAQLKKRGHFSGNRLLAGAALFSLGSAVLSAPLAIEMWKHGDEARITTDAVEWSTMAVSPERLLSGTRYYREWTETDPSGPLAPVWRLVQELPPEKGPILGYGASLLILAGWISLFPGSRNGVRRWPIVYWSMALVPFFWIMLGPEPCLFGIRLPSTTPLLRRLPGFQSIRSAIRYSIPLSLAAAILTGHVMARYRGLFFTFDPRKPGTTMRRRRALYAGIASLAAIGLYLEFLRCPVRTERLPEPPAAYRAGGAVHLDGDPDADPGILLEVPYWYAGGGHQTETIRFNTLYFQTVHQRPMAGGHVSRLIPSAVPRSVDNQVLAYLSRKRPSRYPEPSPARTRAFRSGFGVRYVTVNRRFYRPGDEQRIRQFLEREMDAALIHENGTFLIYEVPRVQDP